jgi:transcription termination/antitermination protein NusG
MNAEATIDEDAVASDSTTADATATDAGPPDTKNWYIVKVQSGREESIKEAVERRVKIEGMEDCFGQIIIPVEKEMVNVRGKRVVRTRKMYPGYIFAKVDFNDRILYLFRETSGVGDFVGAGPNRAPLPMPEHEVEKMLISQLPTEQAREQIKVHVGFEKGDRVRVRDGTFAGMEGEVKEITEPKDAKEPPRVRVELTIFGRPVPVEVEAWQVEAP